jgi:succinate dehydrogenase / fumarate reductase membrane anchor subunit
MVDNRYDNRGSLRTPLSRAKGLGPSGAGTDHFWHHRVSAVSNVPLVIAFVIIVANLAGRPYPEAVEIVSRPFVAILLLLFVASITYHMRLGMQIIIEDYVHEKGAKLAAVIANTFFAIVIAASCLFAILKISFGPLL